MNCVFSHPSVEELEPRSLMSATTTAQFAAGLASVPTATLAGSLVPTQNVIPTGGQGTSAPTPRLA
jgi:hypothetical protein